MNNIAVRVAAAASLLVCTTVLGQTTQIESIEINQAIGVQKNNARKFVAGKETVVRAFLSAAVEVNKAQTSATITRDGELVATLAPNTYEEATAVVDFQCPNRKACGDWKAGSYVFDVTVNGATMSTAGTTYNFVERGELRILAVPVKANYAGTIVPVTDNRWKTFGQYVRNTYPIAADKLIWATREEFDASDSIYDLETDDGQRNLWEALAKLIPAQCATSPQDEDCYSQVFGFIMDRPNTYPNGRLQGFTYGAPANIGVIKDEDAAATVAHEIGHTFGLGDTYEGGSFHCVVNPAPDEFEGKDWDDRSMTIKCQTGKEALEGVSGTKIPPEHHPYEVGGRGALTDVAEYMGSGGKQAQFWTTQEAYDRLFDEIKPPPPPEDSAIAGAPQRFIQCFGLIRQNASTAADVLMDPCWSYEDEGSIPNTAGRYMIVAVNGAGMQVATREFKPEFTPVSPKGLPPRQFEFAPFGEELVFPQGTTKFQILRDSIVLKEIPVSANPPTISNVAPQLTGTQNGVVTVTWEATDPDGDALVYTVLYDPDVTNQESETEILLRDIDEKAFEIDFSEMPGGPHSRIAIIATDGIHATFAQSAEFVVPAKPPEALIYDPPSGYTFVTGQEITFEGDAFDLQDEEFEEDQLQWSSNLSGVLGTGWTLVVPTLPTGRHTITLTATNSAGLKATDSIEIVVAATHRRRAVRR